MTMNNKKIIKKYLNNVSESLSVQKTIKITFLRELKESIKSFVSDRKDISMEDLCQIFGSPDDISNGFANREDYEALLKKAKKVALCWAIIGIICAILLIALGLLLVWIVRESSGSVLITNNF